MAQLPTITELTLVGVADRGVPNRERVVLRPTDTVNLASFALIAAAVREDAAGAVPIANTFLWLGDRQVAPPSWIYVYTGPGEFRDSKIQSTQQPVLVLHWGNSATLFSTDKVQPALLRLNGLAFGGPGQTEAPATAEEDFSLLRALLTGRSEPPSAAFGNTPAPGAYPGLGDYGKTDPPLPLKFSLGSGTVPREKDPSKK